MSACVAPCDVEWPPDVQCQSLSASGNELGGPISLISSGFYGYRFRARGQPVWSLLWADDMEFACATALLFFFVGDVITILDFQIQ